MDDITKTAHFGQDILMILCSVGTYPSDIRPGNCPQLLTSGGQSSLEIYPVVLMLCMPVSGFSQEIP